SLMTEREENGPFTDLEEFCRRMYNTDLNRRALESLIKCGGFDSFGKKRRQLMQMCQTVLDAVNESMRKNIDGQMDMFGMDTSSQSVEKLRYPDVEEYSPYDLMAMEHDVTGLYLSGHPMDEYRAKAKQAGAVSIGAILADYADGEERGARFRDGQKVMAAGVISATKTKTTRNNSLMSYITLDDGTGSIEAVAFQRALDTGSGYVRENMAVTVTGRISARDDKPPQITVDTIRPLSDLDSIQVQEPMREKKLYIKLRDENDPAYKRLKLILIMFPGREQLVLYFADTKKRLGAKCVIHPALVNELREMLGEENVVVK
ncbi:MAG: DNA polymerase III subunit alpha, partial [Oscillospiraceae bacterium]|nr:DNA polymerase III subunit alpha [Oscillospiraceae bacterium]